MDPVARAARVGAGVKWQTVLDAAAPHGLAPLCGSAPGVGVVGYLSGGGIGPLVRSFGLSADHVRAFEMVTGAGQVLRVTPDEHADLFWGLRGGKSMLGIVTAVEIDLLPIAEFYGGAIYFDGAQVADVLRGWQRWSPDLPESVNTSVCIQQLPLLPGIPEPLAGRMTVAVRYTAVGDLAEAQRLLEPIRAVAPSLIDAVGVILAACGPGSKSPQTIVELRLLGGELAREPRHPSAFCHRNAAYSLSVIGVLAPQAGEVVVGHAAHLVNAMAPWSTGGQMPNFAASADPGRPSRCYNEGALHWLRALATRYDPAAVMR